MAARFSVSDPGLDGQDRQGELRRFRDDLYECWTARGDAAFELVDALCCPIPVGGVAYLSLAATARRGHGAALAAVAHGAVDEDRLRDVLTAHRPRDGFADFAVDTSTWPRPDAACSAGRGYYHQRHPRAHTVRGKPVVAGWNFSWLSALSAPADSWTAPLDVRRRTVGDNANAVAVHQINNLLQRLDTNAGASPDASPGADGTLFAFDAGYDPVQLTVDLADTPAQIVVRIRNDRVFFTRPPAPRTGTRRRPGRPKRHGTRFHCAHPASWTRACKTSPGPDGVIHTTHTVNATRSGGHGQVHVHAWQHLHPEHQPYIRDPDGRPTIVECTVIRLQVQHLPHQPGRHPKPIWLWWAGPPGSTPNLDRIWRAYLHRFDLEHTYRFIKQTLGWTTPKLRTPHQADHWTWLIALAYTQLRLARPLIADHHLPWQPPQPTHRMTPGRVRAGFHHLAANIGTPTNQPKPTRAGPGRPTGSHTTPATRHPPHKTNDTNTPTKPTRR
ncbi:NF041680 family putative transposase [Dactylosporangium sp. NPDC005555]|uniref:NF041680 family putative transposase n=1 Tax=Dactylosporangium sp. NPDC005555 TaxID=3154889 RepID=UPI0033B17160